MNNFTTKSQESYLRLVTIFEQELKNYHSIFQKEYYTIHYIVSREQYTNIIEVTVLFKIQRKVLWFELRREPRNLKQLIESFAKYFSFSKIIIVKPYNFRKRDDILKNVVPPIQDRISFELFKSPDIRHN
jgi:hypothetical protein